MLVARDPLGIKPLCYAFEGQSVCRSQRKRRAVEPGISARRVKSLEPGHVITIVNGKFQIECFANRPRRAHCFFEWIYFANVASTLDDRSVYLSRTRSA